jgi:hypothetical protein
MRFHIRCPPANVRPGGESVRAAGISNSLYRALICHIDLRIVTSELSVPVGVLSCGLLLYDFARLIKKFNYKSSGGNTMRLGFALFVVVTSLWTIPIKARPSSPSSVSQPSAGSIANVSTLVGKWTYRSFRNRAALVGTDSNKALDLIFAEAVFTLEVPSSTTLKGALEWPGGGLDLLGTVRRGSIESSPIVDLVGTGRPGTSTVGWEYDYHGQLAPQWSNGVNQVPALLGSVVRAKPHDGAAAGYVASFIAIKQ